MERSYHGYIDKLHKETMNRIHHLDLRLCDEIHFLAKLCQCNQFLQGNNMYHLDIYILLGNQIEFLKYFYLNISDAS